MRQKLLVGLSQLKKLKRLAKTECWGAALKKIRINKKTTCWEWKGTTFKGYGYGWFGSGNSKRVHKFFKEKLFGKYPDGYVSDHLCRNRGCVNPSHIEVVTNKENLYRGNGQAIKTHLTGICKNNHKAGVDKVTGLVRCMKCHKETRRKYFKEYWKKRKNLVKST